MPHFPIMSTNWCHGPHNTTAKNQTVSPSTD
jgi:hypothetical protein